MKNLLITGANGFIAKNFINTFGEAYEIISITSNSEYNILDIDSMDSINNIDVVLHFAAKTYVPKSFTDPYSYYSFNINSTLNIAEFCKRKGIKKIIYLNTYLYGNPSYLPIDELHPIAFHSPYHKSKYLAESLLFNYLEDISNVISLRLFNIYGQGQNQNFLIPTVLEQIKSGKITVKDLEPKRDYLYIQDLLNLLNLIITDDEITGIYNVGSGKSHSVKEIIDIILKTLKVEVPITSEYIRRENEVMDCIANIKKIQKSSGWKPLYTLENGIKNYLNKESFDV